MHGKGTWYQVKSGQKKTFNLFFNLSNKRKVFMLNQVFTLNQCLIFFLFKENIYCFYADLPTLSFSVRPQLRFVLIKIGLFLWL